MRRTTQSAVGIAACALALVLSGCGGGTTSTGTRDSAAQADDASHQALDAYVDAERATIPAYLAESPDLYTDVSIEPEYPSGIVFTYVYAEALDQGAAAKYFDNLRDTMQDLCDNQVFPAMEKAGVTGDLSVTYTYANPDGTQLWTGTFTQ